MAYVPDNENNTEEDRFLTSEWWFLVMQFVETWSSNVSSHSSNFPSNEIELRQYSKIATSTDGNFLDTLCS